MKIIVPKPRDVEGELVEAAMAWFAKRRNRPYTNEEIAALWDACKKLNAVRVLTAASMLTSTKGDEHGT